MSLVWIRGWKFFCKSASSGRGRAGASHWLLRCVLIKNMTPPGFLLQEEAPCVLKHDSGEGIVRLHIYSLHNFHFKDSYFVSQRAFFSSLSFFLFLSAYPQNGLNLKFKSPAVLFLPLTSWESQKVGTGLQSLASKWKSYFRRDLESWNKVSSHLHHQEVTSKDGILKGTGSMASSIVYAWHRLSNSFLPKAYILIGEKMSQILWMKSLPRTLSIWATCWK